MLNAPVSRPVIQYQRAPRPESLPVTRYTTPKTQRQVRITYDFLPYAAIKSLLKKFNAAGCKVIGNCALKDGISFFVAKQVGNSWGVHFDAYICAKVLGPDMLKEEDAASIAAIATLPRGTNPMPVKPWHTH